MMPAKRTPYKNGILRSLRFRAVPIMGGTMPGGNNGVFQLDTWTAGITLALLLTIPAFSVCAAETSVLGMEPGDRRLCNDDIGIIVWGPDSAPTLSVGKSDVWDRRNPPLPEPVIALQDIVERAKAGDPKVINGASYYTAYNSHDFPCPKPSGQIIFMMPFLRPDGTLEVQNDDRSIQLTASKAGKKLRMRVFVSAIRNLIVIDGESAGLEKGDFAVRLQRHRDTIVPGGELHPTLGGGHSPNDFEQLPMPRAGQTEEVFWVAQDFPAEQTFPNGFTSLLAARVSLPATCEISEGVTGLGTAMVAEREGRISHGLTKRFTPINESPGAASTASFDSPGGPFGIMATVVTTQDDPDVLARARWDLAEAMTMGTAALYEEHAKRLDAFKTQPHAKAWTDDGLFKLDVPWGGVPYRIRPDGFYGDIPLCSVDSTKFCCQDSSMWHADFHFNEIEATGLCIQRQFDVLDSYFRMILNLLPMAQSNAREVYGCSGAMFPLVHYPLKAGTVIHTHMTWEQSIEITALISKPFWLRFLYTYDADFLRDMAYPVLREGARFYAGFLKRGDDGLYHVFPTVSPEHRGICKDLACNTDTQSSITLVRYHLRAAAKAAEILGADAGEAARWRDIAEHMPPYPTVDTPEGPIFIDVAGAQPMEYNIPVPLSAVFWGDDIGIDSPAEQIEVARRTLKSINVWEPHRGYLRGVRRRLGIWESSDGFAVENFIQSHTGIIRVFPCVPPDFAGAFEKLGAQGAFVVSAERGGGRVQSLTLLSLAGNPCTLAMPWPDELIKVIDLETANEVPAATREGRIRFQTTPNHKYRVRAVSESDRKAISN